jgi:hypothetical protein
VQNQKFPNSPQPRQAILPFIDDRLSVQSPPTLSLRALEKRAAISPRTIKAREYLCEKNPENTVIANLAEQDVGFSNNIIPRRLFLRALEKCVVVSLFFKFSTTV